MSRPGDSAGSSQHGRSERVETQQSGPRCARCGARLPAAPAAGPAGQESCPLRKKKQQECNSQGAGAPSFPPHWWRILGLLGLSSPSPPGKKSDSFQSVSLLSDSLQSVSLFVCMFFVSNLEFPPQRSPSVIRLWIRPRARPPIVWKSQGKWCWTNSTKCLRSQQPPSVRFNGFSWT